MTNKQQIDTSVTQTNYQPGDTITLWASSSDGSTVVNQGHYPRLLVEAVSGGVVTAFDWLDYGSYKTLPATPGDPMTLVQKSTWRGSGAGTLGTGFTISPVSWTRGAFGTTVDHTHVDLSGGTTTIYLGDNTGAFPLNTSPLLNVQYFYWGHDDGDAINAALAASSAANGDAVVLPGACGTTTPINLPQDSSANFRNPALIGANLQSTGLYAFADSPSVRGMSGGHQVLNRLVYAGTLSSGTPAPPAFGGGISNMLLEGDGIPQGFGYYGLFTSAHIPAGYIGPTIAPNVPSAGDLIEIDSGKYLRIANLHVSDGGIGSGNSTYHCGIDESNPEGAITSGGTGNIIVSDSRFDAVDINGGPKIRISSCASGTAVTTASIRRCPSSMERRPMYCSITATYSARCTSIPTRPTPAWASQPSPGTRMSWVCLEI